MERPTDLIGVREELDQYLQISIGLSKRNGGLVAAQAADTEWRAADLKAMQASLLSSTPTWVQGTYQQGSPFPIIMTRKQINKLEPLHDFLATAITDIVERWWTDHEARYFERMPIEKHEEDLLRWMDQQDTAIIDCYSKHQGSWRPDFLIDQKGHYRICEINGRFAFNGYLHSAYGQQAHIDRDSKERPLTRPALEPQKVYDGLLRLFNPSLPLHLLKGDEIGLDIHLFIDFVHAVTGRRPSLITPAQLRLIPEETSPTGFALFCAVNGMENDSENLERIYQIGLELHQHELREISQFTLREISRRCFNDFRTIFLVHDKRMLGVVLEELMSLVNRKVLTPEQAEALKDGITPSKIPGSPEIERLIRESTKKPDIKDGFILKPIRSGKGDGILFGTDMTSEEWILRLKNLISPAFVKDEMQYVIQQHIDQPRYDILLPGAEKAQRNFLVGTYMAIHGEYIGIGIWRTSPNRICAVSHGGSWVCSVVNASSKKINSPRWPVWKPFTLPFLITSLWKSSVDIVSSFSFHDLFVMRANGGNESLRG